MAFSDNFTGTANSNVEDRTGWTLTSGSAGSLKIDPGGVSTRPQAPSAAVYTCTDQGSADHYTQVDQIVSTNNLISNTFACIRMVDANNFWGYRQTSPGNVEFGDMSSGTFTGKGTFSFTTNDTMYMEGNGTTIAFKINGTHQTGSPWSSETAHQTETSQGFVVGDSRTVNNWDNFSVDTLTVLPTITDVDTDNSITSAQLNVVITGTDFEATQGTGHIDVSPTDNVADSNRETFSTVDSWGDTSVQFDFVQGGLPYGTAYFFVTNNSTESNSSGQAVTIAVESGTGYVDITSVDAEGLVNTFTNLAIGDQIDYDTTSSGGGTVTVNADGTYSIDYSPSAPPASDSFDARAWDATDYTWSSSTTININDGSATPSGGLGRGLISRMKLRRQ